MKHFFPRRYTCDFFCPKLLKCNYFGHFLLKTQYTEKKVKHSNSACYIVLFFSEKRPNVTIFLPNENDQNGYFSAVSDKKSGRFTFGRKMFNFEKTNVLLRKNLNFPKWNIFSRKRKPTIFFVKKCSNVTILVIFWWKRTRKQRWIFKSETFKFCLLHRPFFYRKKAKCNHFFTEGRPTFSAVSEKKSGRFTLGRKNISPQKN